MRQRVVFFLFLSLFLGCKETIIGVSAKPTLSKNHEKEVLLIQWAGDPDLSLIEQYQLKEREVFRMEGFNPWYVYKVKDEEQVFAALEGHPAIAHLELDLFGEVTNLPADPGYFRQWGLENGSKPLYAASRGDFVLGGLQAIYETDLNRLVDDFVDGEMRCALDPGCESAGGSCAVCLQIGEPSCRLFNTFLSRSAISGPRGFLACVDGGRS